MERAEAQAGVLVSSSSGGKDHKVFAFQDDGRDRCDCIAFAMARNRKAKKDGVRAAEVVGVSCKHLGEVYATTCPWTGAVTDTCPRCGSPTIEDGYPVPVTPPTREQLADLLRGLT